MLHSFIHLLRSLLPKSFRSILVPTVLLLAMCISFFGLPSDILVFKRTLIDQGQVWRILSNILTHSNLYHLLLNAASVLLIWGIYANEMSVRYSVAITAYTSLFTGLCLYYISDISTYMGFSGALYGIILLAAYPAVKSGDKLSLALTVIVVGRVVWQQFEGPAEDLAELIGARVAIESHLYGVASAFSWIVLDQLRLLIKKAQQPSTE